MLSCQSLGPVCKAVMYNKTTMTCSMGEVNEYPVKSGESLGAAMVFSKQEIQHGKNGPNSHNVLKLYVIGIYIFFLAAEHFMIIAKTPKIFVNASRSLKSSSKTWVTSCPVTIKFEYGGVLNAGAIGCSKDGECYHLKFGGMDWTYVGSFAAVFRDEGNAGVFDGAFWVFGGIGKSKITSRAADACLGDFTWC